MSEEHHEPNLAAELAAYMGANLDRGPNFEARVLGASYAIREDSKNAYGQTLLDARLQLLAIADLVYAYKASVPGATSQPISDRLVLLAQFFQGVGPMEALISEGQYVKAAAALKQDVEILARLHETLQGVAKAGKTPNVKYAPTGAGKVYGELNDVAHPSNPGVAANLLGTIDVDGGYGVSYVPVFVADTAVSLYEIHVWLLLEMCRELVRVMEDLYGADVELVPAIRWWAVVGDQLAEAGHIGAV